MWFKGSQGWLIAGKESSPVRELKKKIGKLVPDLQIGIDFILESYIEASDSYQLYSSWANLSFANTTWLHELHLKLPSCYQHHKPVLPSSDCLAHEPRSVLSHLQPFGLFGSLDHKLIQSTECKLNQHDCQILQETMFVGNHNRWILLGIFNIYCNYL